MIYAIGDLHFDNTGEKPMGIFGDNWIDHEEQIIKNWNEIIGEEDLVLIPGDISWALKEEDACKDLKKIDKLPGKKILSKGNHDYWWTSLKKMNNFGFASIRYLQNNNFVFNNIRIIGSRGWIDNTVAKETGEEDLEHSEKIFKREIHRLKLSLESQVSEDYKKTIAMLHYPPFDTDMKPNELGKVLEEYEVDYCIYGHLHGEGHKFVKEGNINGVEYICVSSDYIDFKPIKVV